MTPSETPNESYSLRVRNSRVKFSMGILFADAYDQFVGFLAQNRRFRAEVQGES